MANVVSTILNVLGALLILDVIVVAHELGHYLTARALKIKVLEFAIGMGPRVLSHTSKKTGTIFALRAFPIGGMCMFVGDDDGEYASTDAMNNQPPWKRFLTILGGPAANFLLAYAVVFVLFTAYGLGVNAPIVGEVSPGSPAQIAGVLVEDQIAAVDGVELPFTPEGRDQLMSALGASDPETGVSIRVRRGEQAIEIPMKPALQEDGIYRYGISIGQVIGHLPPLEAFRASFTQILKDSTLMLDGLKKLVFQGEGAGDMMGPVGIVSVMSSQVTRGWDIVFWLMELISLNLGIMNLLPLPALDGGRLLFILWEMIFRKPVKPEFEGWIHAGGFLLLIGLIVVVSFRDVMRLMGIA